MALIKKKKCCNCEELFEPNPQNAKHQNYCRKPECRKASKDESQRRWLEKNPEYFRGPTHVKRVQEWRRANPGYSRRQYKNRKNALQKSLEPETPTSALQEASEPENPTSALKETLEPKKRTSPLQETLEPEKRNRALQEPLEPENRTSALQEALEPENRPRALQKTSEPKKRAKALQETSVPGKSTNALQDLWQPYLFENKENTPILQLHALQETLAIQQAVLIGLIANITGSALQDSLDNTLRRMRDLGMDIVNNSNTLKGGTHDEKVSHPPGSYPQNSKPVQLGRSPTGP
jgi:hypothetical protein